MVFYSYSKLFLIEFWAEKHRRKVVRIRVFDVESFVGDFFCGSLYEIGFFLFVLIEIIRSFRNRISHGNPSKSKVRKSQREKRLGPNQSRLKISRIILSWLLFSVFFFFFRELLQFDLYRKLGQNLAIHASIFSSGKYYKYI